MPLFSCSGKAKEGLVERPDSRKAASWKGWNSPWQGSGYCCLWFDSSYGLPPKPASGSKCCWKWAQWELGRNLGPLILPRFAGTLSFMAEMGRSALRRTLEPRHFFECLLSSQTVTFSIPQPQPQPEPRARGWEECLQTKE